ncbi:MAG: TIM barrel protein [Eubacteriales bacterium]
MKNVALASYSFHGLLGAGMMDLFGYLETVRYRMNLLTADIWNGMFISTDNDYVQKVKTALGERDLTLVNLCVDGPHLWDDDPDIRAQHKKEALRWLDIAGTLDAKTIRIDVGVRDKTPLTAEQLDYVGKTYAEYAHIAAESGFRVGPENHWGASLLIGNMEAIYSTVSNPAYGILFHVKPWDDDSEHGFERAARFAMHTHLDYKTCTGDIEGVIRKLCENGYTGCFSAEHHTGKNEYTETVLQLGAVMGALDRLSDSGVVTTGGFNPLLRRDGLE